MRRGLLQKKEKTRCSAFESPALPDPSGLVKGWSVRPGRANPRRAGC